MSIRIFCDRCHDELLTAEDERVSHRIVRVLDCIKIEIIVGVALDQPWSPLLPAPSPSSFTWNGGQVCRRCVTDTAIHGKDIIP